MCTGGTAKRGLLVAPNRKHRVQLQHMCMNSNQSNLMQDDMSCAGTDINEGLSCSSMEEDLAMLSIGSLAGSEDEDVSYHPSSRSDNSDESTWSECEDDDDADFETHVDMHIQDHGLQGSGSGCPPLVVAHPQLLSLLQLLLSHGAEIDATDNKVRLQCLHMMKCAMLLRLQIRYKQLPQLHTVPPMLLWHMHCLCLASQHCAY